MKRMMLKLHFLRQREPVTGAQILYLRKMTKIQRRFLVTLILVIMLIVFGSTGYYFIFQGQEDFVDCLYMTIITLTTVGYGEVIPIQHSMVAKVFTMLLMVFGIGVLAYAVSLGTAFLVEGELTDILRRWKMNKEISQLRDHFIVCGAGETGAYVLEELVKVGRKVVLIDSSEERSEIISYLGEDSPFVSGDSTEDEVLLEAGIERAYGIVICLPSDKDNLFITVTARQLNPRIRIVSKGVGRKMVDKLKRAGANSVICPNAIGGLRMASEMIRPAVVSFLDIMLRDSRSTMRIEEIKIQEGSELADKTLIDLDFKHKYNLLILAIVDPDHEIHYNPEGKSKVSVGTTLILMGSQEQVTKVRDQAEVKVHN